MIAKTILIALITVLGYSEWLLGTSLIQRPIILGPLVGLALGNPSEGIIMGATLELAMVGAVSVGAYIPPDLVSGSVLGIALAIESQASPAAALTLGIPVATIMLALNTALGRSLMLILIHKADRDAKKTNTKAITWDMIIASYCKNLPGLFGTPLAFYFGSAAVTKLLGNIPQFVSTGMSVAANILPALGFAMLAQMIWNKKVAVFFFLGFFMVAYGKLSITGVAIFAVILVVIMYIFFDKRQKIDTTAPSTQANKEGDGFDEF